VETVSEQELSRQYIRDLRYGQYIGNNTVLEVRKDKFLKTELTTNKVTELATGFDPKVYYIPLSEKGNCFLVRSEMKFYKNEGSKLILAADVNTELRKSGYAPQREVFITTSKLNTGSDFFAFSFVTFDSVNLCGSKPFFDYPEFGLFNLKTGKLSFLGKRAAPSKRATFYAGTLIYNDASQKRILTASVGSLTISAYNTKGKLRTQSRLPDSIKNDYRTIDQIPPSKYKGLSFFQTANILQWREIDDYYRVQELVRLNDDQIGLIITNGAKLVYLVFDNDLKFKGQFEEPYISNEVAYHNGDITTFMSRYENKIKTVRIR
jgi:hypothetical protein